jgi:hypothetical protein
MFTAKLFGLPRIAVRGRTFFSEHADENRSR